MAAFDRVESRTLEIKEEIPGSYRALIRTCVAFANDSGGDLIIGVRDNDLEIMGVPLVDVEKFLEDFPNAIHQAVNPTIIPQIKTHNIDGKYILSITIPMGMSKPYCVSAEGFPDGVYLRSGRSTLRAKKDHVEEIKLLTSSQTYDGEPIKVDVKELNREILTKIYGENFTKETLASDRVLVADMTGQTWPTRAAVLMFCNQPHHDVPEAITLVTQFRGVDGRDIVRTSEIEGPIPVLLDKTVRLTQAWTESHFKLQGAVLAGESPVPTLALREIIANALIHRKYSVAGAVKVAIYDDRIEIFSPGDLPPGIRVEDLGHGVTDLRNPLLAKFARKLKIMEKLGTGIRAAVEACHRQALKTPEFIEGANFFKAIFYFEKCLHVSMNSDTLALKILKERGWVDKQSLVQAGVADRTASKILSDLVAKGLLLKVGRGPKTRYIAAS